jgi:RecA-family ATPase
VTLKEPSDIIQIGRYLPDDSPARTTRFTATRLDKIELPKGPPALIEDILFPRTLAVVFGEPGCGKSFLVSHMVLFAACGWTWAGKMTSPGTAVYVCAEGARGFLKRMVGFRERMEPPAGAPFFVITDAPDLGHAEGDAEALIQRIREQVGDRVSIVVIDTLARVLHGADENSAADMSTMVDNAAKLTDALGASVVLIHHCGKDPARGARGSSVLHAAADTEILIGKREGGNSAIVTKQRDGETGLVLGFSLEQIAIEGDDGETSCIGCR